MQEGSTGENSATPEHLTDSGGSYLDKLYELVRLAINEIDNGRVIGGSELERDARIGLKVLVAVEEMPPEEIAPQRDFLCSLLFHTGMLLERYDLRVFTGRVIEKIFDIDPNYFPINPDEVTPDATDEAPAQPKDNPLLEIPGL